MVTGLKPVNLHILLISLFSILLSYSLSSYASGDYVGTEQCIDCHKDEYEAWKGSDHDMSMRHAAPDAVLGDFNNATIMFKGKENKFFKKGDQYWVNIEGPDGKFHDYQIKYTFAYKPLQQYMVEFEDGRVQLIPFAWGAHDDDKAGPKWFHLYPEFTEKHDDYFWTNTGQNWNYMCADCHSTDVKKNFDVETNTYNTTFSEINVGCESCHGPGSEHMEWSKEQDKSVKHAGFDRDITKQVTNWILKEGKSTLMPEKIDHTQQTLVCAQCHSRRTQISNDDHVKTNDFGNKYLLSLLTPRLYYPDGQIYDEDFVYGSFLQSKMNQQGVVCTNCHDPHKAELAIPKEAVCLQCHLPNKYAVKEHHKHEEGGEGAQCTNCHMAETTYMQVDDRADHAWHSPRPDLANTLGTPDTCLSCHEEKDSNWSQSWTEKWYPNSKVKEERHFGPVFAAADRNMGNISAPLTQIAQNNYYANIVRASAMERMAAYPDTNSIISLARGAKNEDSNMRVGAIRGAINLRGPERWRIVAPLLMDDILSVRTEAALALAPLWDELSDANKETIKPALDEYIAIQDYNADRGYAHTNKGNILTYQSKFEEAEKAYKESMRIEPYFTTAYVNLADLYRRQNNGTALVSTLEAGMKAVPDNGIFPYSLGLYYIRNKQSEKAILNFKKATELTPTDSNFHYVYALSVEATNPLEAQKAFRKAYQAGGNPQHLYALCNLFINQKSFQAQQCINELSLVAPEDAVNVLKQRLK